MKKILVTTDFSTNSKAGIRFAIQLASQTNSELVFYNVIKILKPSVWKQIKWENHVEEESNKKLLKLKNFIHSIYKNTSMKKPIYRCVVEVETIVDMQIIAFAQTIQANYICMSTKGAGNIRKIFGTNAASLIATSPIPVIVVPHNYRRKQINSIWFTSDYENLNSELSKVLEFNKSLSSKLLVTHYHLLNKSENNDNITSIIAKNESENVEFKSVKRNINYTLVEQIQADIKKVKPSILVLFTKQNRSWLERWILASTATELVYDMKTPMLVFKK